MVEFSLTVGKVDASLALLLTKDHHMIEFPTLLLPEDVEAGSIVTIRCDKDVDRESEERAKFSAMQNEILETFGTDMPKIPQLRVRNVTQTSVVLEWDTIEVATAEVISLTLYKNNARFGIVPNPLKRTTTKLSGLAIDNVYEFHLELKTTAGVFTSEHISVKTHKMTDLSGITVCVGSLSGSDVSYDNIVKTVEKIGAKPVQDTVKLDTTHFVCTTNEGAQCRRAQDLNIPVVQPEWLKACESERRLVGVRAYYLNADPRLRPPAIRSRAESSATTDSFSRENVVVPGTRSDESQDKQEEAQENGSSQLTRDLPSAPEVTVTDAEMSGEHPLDKPSANANAATEDDISIPVRGTTSPTVAAAADEQSYSRADLPQVTETSVEQTEKELESQKPITSNNEPVQVSLTEIQADREVALPEESKGEEQLMAEPTVEEPVTEEPVTEEPVTEQPVAEEPITEEPTTEQVTAEEPTTEEVTAEEPTTEDVTAEEPITEEVTAEEPTTEQVEEDTARNQTEELTETEQQDGFDSSTAVDEPLSKAEEAPAPEPESEPKSSKKKSKRKNKKSRSIDAMESINLN